MAYATSLGDRPLVEFSVMATTKRDAMVQAIIHFNEHYNTGRGLAGVSRVELIRRK